MRAQPQLLIVAPNILAALNVGTAVFSHHASHISNEHSRSNNESKELIEKDAIRSANYFKFRLCFRTCTKKK